MIIPCKLVYMISLLWYFLPLRYSKSEYLYMYSPVLQISYLKDIPKWSVKNFSGGLCDPVKIHWYIVKKAIFLYAVKRFYIAFPKGMLNVTLPFRLLL